MWRKDLQGHNSLWYAVSGGIERGIPCESSIPKYARSARRMISALEARSFFARSASARK